MEFQNTAFPDLFIVKHFRAADERGVFVKPWLAGDLADRFGVSSEAYFSSSQPGTLRGLHFQVGEHAQKKYVVCLEGAVEDIAVDLRPTSPTYGKVFRTRLSALDGQGVIIPEGFAHGIFAHEQSVIVNFCDKPYAPGEEGGIIWSSLPGLDDLDVRVLSEKDRALPSLETVLAS